MSKADAFDIVLPHPPVRQSRRVFIARRDSGEVSAHEKALVASGEFQPVFAHERGTAGSPPLHDLIEQMRGCDTAIIQVTAGTAAGDTDRQLRISGDALIEIGAAMALYGREFVLLVEDAIELPPSLHGLCECRYSGNELNMPAMMQLLRAFKSFTPWPSGRLRAISGVKSSGAKSSCAKSALGSAQQADMGATKH
jgi:predicted nucleotide-binding protein